MPKQNKDSRFDRVIAGARRLNENKTLEKADTASERFMQSRANKAMGEGKEWKAKAYAAAEGVRKAGMPTGNIGLAAGVIGAGAAGKAVSKAGKAKKGMGISKKVDAGIGRMKDFVKESNKVDEIAKSKGIKRIKTTAGPDKGKVKYTSSKKENVEAFRDKDYSRKMLQNNLKEGQRQAIKYPNKESASDLKEIDMNWHNAQTSEKGFTKRGKPIGKKIGDIRPKRK